MMKKVGNELVNVRRRMKQEGGGFTFADLDLFCTKVEIDKANEYMYSNEMYTY